MKLTDETLWMAQPPLNGSMAGLYQRAALAISRMGKETRNLIFTAPRAGTGTSVTTLNVGRQLRGLGVKALVVELNRLHSVYGARLEMSEAPGVNGILSGMSIAEAARPDASGLPVLPLTEPWPSAKSIACVATAIVEKTSQFDIVLFDSPPLFDSADTLAIGSVVRDTIIVIRAGRTSAEALSSARQQCEEAGLRIRGSILNMRERIMPTWMDRWLEGL